MGQEIEIIFPHHHDSLGLELGDKLQHQPLGVLLMLGVGQVQVSGEVLIQPGGQVVPRL